MNFPKYPKFEMDRPLFRALWDHKLDLLFCTMLLKYLEAWGVERTTPGHKLALAYLLNLELPTSNWVDRGVLMYVYTVNKGLETNSLFDRLVKFYIVKRGLKTDSLFDLICRGFMRLLNRGRRRSSIFDRMAVTYLLPRCNEAVYKGLSMGSLRDVFDLAKVEGKNFINENLEKISKTPMSFETAKLAIAFRSTQAFERETSDEFQHNAEMGYWIGALERLLELDEKEN
uniref:Uncharacterized protein n=1 Tax=Lobelia cardinalis TaxID=76578 RepID=A0A291F635_LOBCA|nr:hypothetical protein Lo_car1Pt0556 [Lobelia cardinalis]ATG27586.1 hypothetical protein Lo_car1Pt0556 [Lobelia cardinalis]